MLRFARFLLLPLLSGLILVQVGCCCCTCATPVRRNPILDRLRNSANPQREQTTGHRSANFEDRSDAEVIPFEVRQGMTRIDLDARVKVDQGSVHLTLTDPIGFQRWDQVITAGSTHRDARRFPPVPGTWTLRIGFGTASGSYQIEWTVG